MSVNKVILLGRLGKDPEVRNLDNGNVVANFSMVTTERGYTRKDGQQVEEKSDWHNIVVWGGQAKVVDKFVRKGSMIYIEGKLRTRSYEAQDGKKYITEIVCENLELLGGKKEEDKPF